ncbi:elongator complex protein 1 [Schistosoma bovis]|uniref:Elongator complex protein 1 n=2 Tax=Schistosoma TaxID=6181 RepID=A0A430QML5_SCHBO|nr:elongator complex protein 1 [Schistosoma bovis]
MRNLNLSSCGGLWLEGHSVRHISLDDCSNNITVSFERSIEVISSTGINTYHAQGTQQEIHSCFAISPPVYLVACSNEIFLWHSLNHQIYEKLDLNTELKAIRISPDLSKTVVITGDGFIHILSSTLETISNFSLYEEGFGSALPVSLGWGKKETQFHGSEGKEAALAKPTVPVSNTQYDDGRFEIAWRDDGLYFAVSWIDPLTENRRRIRVYNDTGELFSTTELTNMISPGLCWRPRVQLITTAQRREGRGLDIIFFESNSQRHGEFELIGDESEKFYQVESIMFNPTGSILAVLCSGTQNHPWFIRLLTCSNYQWSIKQHFCIADNSLNDSQISNISLTWDHHAYSADLSALYCAISINESLPNDNQVNNTVEMSCFAYSVIPPPMFATRLVFYSNGVNQSNKTQCNFTPSVSSVSIPSLWLGNESDSPNNVMPILIQTVDCQSSKNVFPNTYFITITNGTSLEKESFCNGEVYSEWHNGGKNIAPWPKTVVKIDMDRLFIECNGNDESLNSLILTELKQKNTCLFSPLSCFAWLSLYEVLFIGADGLLLGYLNMKNLYASDDDSDGNANGRWLLRASSSAQEFKTLLERNNSKFARITTICCTIDRRVCVQMSNGTVYIYSVQDILNNNYCYEILQMDEFNIDNLHSYNPLNCIIQFPSNCEQLLCIPVFDEYNYNIIQLNSSIITVNYSALILFGFNKSTHCLFAAVLPKQHNTGHFQQNNIIALNITDSCSSLIGLSEFLIVTNVKKLLICVSLVFNVSQINDPNSLLKELLSRLNIPSELDASTRKPPRNWYNDNLHPIESGAIIVTAIPNDTKVILQMPRGNLEEIHPPVKMMRRHRINFNLLHDYNPNLFLSNVKQFLQSIDDPDLITLFISDLVEEDVTETIYHKFYSKSSERHRSTLKTSKLDRITDILIDEMEKHNPTKLIVPIITCYAKKVPPNYEAGLLRLKLLHENGDINTWNNGLRHLQYFATPIELYKVALGTYDLNFATIMAQRTQLDPKEYLAELNELNSITNDLKKYQCDTMEEAIAYQQFKIDHSLKKYSKAVLHLIDSGSKHKAELLSYVKAYHLYAQVTEVIPQNSEEFKIICQLWADYLISSQNLSYAGQIYMKGGFYGLAAKTFLSVTNTQLWCIAAANSRLLNDKNNTDLSTDHYLSNAEIRTQAQKLAARLKDLQRHQEAIQIYIDFLEASLYNKQEFLNQILKSSLSEHYSILKEKLRKSIDTYDKLFDRLITLRQMHKQQAETQRFVQMHGDREYFDDNFSESDINSDTSSMSGDSITSSMSQISLRTSGSKKSGRSMKAKRKQEAKKWSSKPGSKYEEVGLLHELTQSIELGQSLANEVMNSLTEFWYTNMFGEGRTLICSTNDLLRKQKQGLSSIWDDWITGKVGTNQDFSIYSPKANKLRNTSNMLIALIC